MTETILLTILGTLLVLWVTLHVYQRRKRLDFRKRFLEAITDMMAFPTKEITVGGQKYLVSFVCPPNPDAYNVFTDSSLKEYQEEIDEDKNDYTWGVFCGADMAAIETFISYNPNVTVLNIPTEQMKVNFPKRAMYKVVKIK